METPFFVYCFLTKNLNRIEIFLLMIKNIHYNNILSLYKSFASIYKKYNINSLNCTLKTRFSISFKNQK